MANHKSAVKAARKAARNALRNRVWKSMVKTAIRRVREATRAGEAEKASALLSRAFKVIDKAQSKGVLHSNTAARKKSRLARSVAAVSHQA